jgi:hypothetical protein
VLLLCCVVVSVGDGTMGCSCWIVNEYSAMPRRGEG